MRAFPDALPIDDALPGLLMPCDQAIARCWSRRPGAGKTTRVPLALLDEPFAKAGKIIVLEPRRLAARAAAARMAATLGEKVGETVGLRVRLQSLVSARTRVEVVTEGVFARMILDDPSLEGVPRCCSTSSTSARSTPTLASRSRSMRRRACARTCACS